MCAGFVYFYNLYTIYFKSLTDMFEIMSYLLTKKIKVSGKC